MVPRDRSHRSGMQLSAPKYLDYTVGIDYLSEVCSSSNGTEGHVGCTVGASDITGDDGTVRGVRKGKRHVQLGVTNIRACVLRG